MSAIQLLYSCRYKNHLLVKSETTTPPTHDRQFPCYCHINEFVRDGRDTEYVHHPQQIHEGGDDSNDGYNRDETDWYYKNVYKKGLVTDYTIHVKLYGSNEYKSTRCHKLMLMKIPFFMTRLTLPGIDNQDEVHIDYNEVKLYHRHIHSLDVLLEHLYKRNELLESRGYTYLKFETSWCEDCINILCTKGINHLLAAIELASYLLWDKLVRHLFAAIYILVVSRRHLRLIDYINIYLFLDNRIYAYSEDLKIPDILDNIYKSIAINCNLRELYEWHVKHTTQYNSLWNAVVNVGIINPYNDLNMRTEKDIDVPLIIIPTKCEQFKRCVNSITYNDPTTGDTFYNISIDTSWRKGIELVYTRKFRLPEENQFIDISITMATDARSDTETMCIHCYGHDRELLDKFIDTVEITTYRYQFRQQAEGERGFHNEMRTIIYRNYIKVNWDSPESNMFSVANRMNVLCSKEETKVSSHCDTIPAFYTTSLVCRSERYTPLNLDCQYCLKYITVVKIKINKMIDHSFVGIISSNDGKNDNHQT